MNDFAYGAPVYSPGDRGWFIEIFDTATGKTVEVSPIFSSREEALEYAREFVATPE